MTRKFRIAVIAVLVSGAVACDTAPLENGTEVYASWLVGCGRQLEDAGFPGPDDPLGGTPEDARVMRTGLCDAAFWCEYTEYADWMGRECVLDDYDPRMFGPYDDVFSDG